MTTTNRKFYELQTNLKFLALHLIDDLWEKYIYHKTEGNLKLVVPP